MPEDTKGANAVPIRSFRRSGMGVWVIVATIGHRKGFPGVLEPLDQGPDWQLVCCLIPAMYPKSALSEARQAFWTTFGQYMKPVVSAEGMPVNWINYKTGVGNLYFRMDALYKAQISIDITHSDPGIRQLYFDQFRELKGLLEQHVGEPWTWVPPGHGEKTRIYRESEALNIMSRDAWPGLISFFKPRIMGLDAFWSEARYAFEALE